MASSTLVKGPKSFGVGVRAGQESGLPGVFVEAVNIDHTLNRNDKPFKGYLFLVFNDNHNFVKLSL
jgi:hypothetical protein